MGSYSFLDPDAIDAKPVVPSTPGTSTKTRKFAERYSEQDWEPQKERIRQLYLVEERPLISKPTKDWRETKVLTVAQLMEDRHGFKATERQYKRRIERWRFKKYVRAHEIEAVIESFVGDGPGTNLTSCLPPNIEIKKIQRYKRRKALRALRDAPNSALPCPSPPQLNRKRALICDDTDSVRSYYTIYKLESFYRKGSALSDIGVPIERLTRPHIPSERDWVALFVAQFLITTWPEIEDPSLIIDCVRGTLMIMALPENTVFFALYCIQRLRKMTFDAVDLAWYPHRLLVMGLMLANQLLDDTPYSKFDWADVSGIPLWLLTRMELRCLMLTGFRLLEAPSGGWDVSLANVKESVSRLKTRCNGHWPSQYTMSNIGSHYNPTLSNHMMKAITDYASRLSQSTLVERHH